jgi:hypothetical protein
MTREEREKVKQLLKKLYHLLDRARKEHPNNQVLQDRLLDDINLARTLLKL